MPNVLKSMLIHCPVAEVIHGVLDASTAPIYDPSVVTWGTLGESSIRLGGSEAGGPEWEVVQFAVLQSLARPVFARAAHRFAVGDGATQYTCEITWEPSAGRFGRVADWLLERALRQHMTTPFQVIRSRLERGNTLPLEMIRQEAAGL